MKKTLKRYKTDGDPVYKDSCLEFFINFYPNMLSRGYLNFEMNAFGTLLVEYGVDNFQRRMVLNLLSTRPFNDTKFIYKKITEIVTLRMVI